MPSEITFRLGFFFGIFVSMLVWEGFSPKRKLKHPRKKRWPANLGIIIISSFLVRLSPLIPIGVAVWVEENNIGILGTLPFAGAVVIGLLLLDLIIYIQHLLFHRIRFFWNFHKMHHTDLDFDATTALRFHPVEIIFSILIKMAFIIILGVPALAVLIFEIVLNGTSMFNHGNVRINTKLDKILRKILVTPDMHRVHHSYKYTENNSNFGFNLPWWDYIFRTYKSQPSGGHMKMTLGLPYFRDSKYLGLKWLLLIPFIKERK